MSIRRVKNVDDLVYVQNAVVSVSDKSDLDVLAKGLVRYCSKIRIFSTGGTYRRLVEILGDRASRHVQEVSDYTGMPETAGGLVKSLHHKLFLGYLTEKHCYQHQRDLEREGAVPIDLVVANLYPFEQVVAQGGDIEDARGNIDVGGPSMVRAAAKNWPRVAAVVSPGDYSILLDELMVHGCTTLKTRFDLHKKAFRLLADYNKVIADYVKDISFEQAVKAYDVMGSD